MGRFDSLELGNITPAASNAAEREHGEKVKDAQYFIDSGEEHFYRMEYEEALRDYSAAIRIDPGAVPAWRGQVLCLLFLQEFRETELWLGKAVELVGENADFLALFALVHSRKGDWERACGYSDAAMESAGGSPLPLIARGELFLYAKRNGEYCFEQAFALCPDWKTALLIVDSCLFSGRRKAAVLALRYLDRVKQSGERVELALASLRVNLALRRMEAARESAEEAETLGANERLVRKLKAGIPQGFRERLRRWFGW